ncbi:MAG: HNH endonuclease [Nitrososphaeraceae archaeon]
MEKCEICGRKFGDKSLIQFHHLIPKTFKGKTGILTHKMCHQKLHATLSEREMLNYYHTVDRLLEHEEIQKFVKWVQNKPIDFYDKNDDTTARHKKRKR